MKPVAKGLDILQGDKYVYIGVFITNYFNNRRTFEINYANYIQSLITLITSIQKKLL